MKYLNLFLDCGHRDFPGVFTKVSYFVEWIEATVQAHQNKTFKFQKYNHKKKQL